MCRWWIHGFVVLLFVAVFPALCQYRTAANETTFVNNTKSRLKILAIFGHFGKSHFEVFKPLLEELARRGHDLTVLSHFPRSESAKQKEALPNYKDISLLDSKVGIFVDIIDLNLISHTTFRFFMDFYMLRIMADMACNTGLKNPDVKKLLQSDEKYDLILTESFNTDCFLGFIHRFKAPYISLSSHEIMPWTNDDISNEDNPSYIPLIFFGFTRPMSFFNRVKNTVFHSFYKVAYDIWFRYNDQAIASEVFGPDLPALREIAKQMQGLLVNTHSSLYGNNPKLPNVVEVGGLHIPPETKPLPKDVAEFLDGAHEGVLYFSFGSMIKMSTMPQKKLDAIFKVLASLPCKVLWKWEEQKLPYKMDNVMVKKWLPQFDILSK